LFLRFFFHCLQTALSATRRIPALEKQIAEQKSDSDEFLSKLKNEDEDAYKYLEKLEEEVVLKFKGVFSWIFFFLKGER